MDVPVASAGCLFATATPPPAVIELSQRLQSLMVDPHTLRQLVSLAVRHLKRQRPQAAEWRALVAGSYLPPAAFDELFAGVVQLAAAVLRLADAKFQPARVADQLAALKLPPQVINDLLAHRAQARQSTVSLAGFRRLSDVQWRIDITLASSRVSRVLEPRVLLQLEVEAGPADAAAADRRRHLVHLTPAQFHSLRYQVALRCDQLRRLDASTAAAAAAAPAPS